MSKVDGNLTGVIGTLCDHLGPTKPVIFPTTVSEIPALELPFLPERYYMSSKSTSYDSNMLSPKTVTKMIENLVVY